MKVVPTLANLVPGLRRAAGLRQLAERALPHTLEAAISPPTGPDRGPIPLPERDRRLDFLRGLCLAIMLIDHLPPMRLQKLSYESFGFITAAEGFILISGLTSGWVYSKTGKPASRIWKRWRDIYLTYAALMGLLLILSLLLGGPHIRINDWLLTLAGVLGPLGHTVSGGILLIYLVLLPCLPFVLRQFRIGRASTVLCSSFGLWLLGQVHIGPEISIGYLFAWQFLFILGAWAGYCRQAGIVIPGFSSRLTLRMAAVGVALFFLCRHPMIRPPVLSLSWAITNKEQLGIVRLMDIGFLALLIAGIPRTFDLRWLGTLPCRPLCFLGRHSLPVFSWHVVIAWLIRFSDPQWVRYSLSVQVCLTAVLVLSLFLPAYLHERWKSARTEGLFLRRACRPAAAV